MNYKEEIEYRKILYNRATKGEKLTKEERFWAATHRSYNKIKGYSFLNIDIIELQPKGKYYVTVRIEKINYPNRFSPIFSVPGGKGLILTDYNITDYNGKISPPKPIKMLGFSDLSENDKKGFHYVSGLGLMGISFQCDYYDPKHRLHLRQSSDTGNPSFAMLREDLSENKVLYRCKPPFNDDFDSFVFSVEWCPEH